MSNPLFSVITPIYNCEEYLAESIESVLAQTFSDYEFLIINDGSTDSSKDIALSYKDERIRFVDNEDNLRIPTRRNQGIVLARGKYVAIHDGDDVSLPDRFEKQAEVLNEDDSLFCIGGHAIKIDSEGNECGIMDYPPADHADILSMISRRCMNPMIDPTTIFQRRKFLELGKYTLEKAIYTVPDFDLWTRAIISGCKFGNISSCLIRYRANPEGMTKVHKKEMIGAHMIVWRRFMTKYLGQRRERHGRAISPRRD
tara:strand:- start:667 stop:1434 length:768 start_codon:yes stop_codon:yes gene_type:complete